MQETPMLVCPSDACVCTMHEHHEEARAPLMRVASMCDWTKQTDPRVYDRSVKCDWRASSHVHGVGSAVHTWTQQTLQSKHDETQQTLQSKYDESQLCGPCLTSQDTEEPVLRH